MVKEKIHKQSGQTLILGVLAILFLFIATLIIFDLSSVIKTKFRSQTAVDAASLAACNWQVQSLNLIGELNLVKACTALVSDIYPLGDDSPEGIESSVDILTEMQARISFVGPLIGFGAAQQAAKNNRMSNNSHYTSIVYQHIEHLMDDNYYGEDVGIPQEIEGYSWREPYSNMLYQICNEGGGIAVAPNTLFAGLPQIDPSWLMDLGLYDSIAARYWCYPTLRNLLKTYSFEGKWWDLEIISEMTDFIEESEYLPLHIEFSSAGDLSIREDALPYLENIASERSMIIADEFDDDEEPDDLDEINSPLPYQRWCIYDSNWESASPSSEWLSGSYLRSPLKTEYAYGGALSKMTSEIKVDYQSSAYSINNLKSGNIVTKGSPQTIDTESSALAKPLGSLGDSIPPTVAKMVLPIFTKSRLIPIAMQDPSTPYNPFDSRQYELYEFLLWLDGISDLENPGSSPPAGGYYYLSCLQNLGKESWRSSGYNRNYVDTGEYPTTAYDEESNPTGAGWLQMGHTYEYNESGDPVAIIDINEDTCDDWIGGGGSGPRYGPSVLH
ncbi:MAG TPA: Tad domain-containing protein [Victivallales bacterium]|nr:Tad domain-containing protein [Victivallales bacterium]HRU01276.1 Tad domain-containing protein [Victivallales bacterium]